MKRLTTAVIAAAAVFVFPASADAQSYSELRARAACLELGASGPGLDECVRSIRRREILQGLGSALQNLDQQYRQPPAYVGPYHPFIAPPVGWQQPCRYGQRC